jgi:hypothetical protein
MKPRFRLAPSLAGKGDLERGAEDQLLFRERKQYLGAIQDALAGAGRGGEADGKTVNDQGRLPRRLERSTAP